MTTYLTPHFSLEELTLSQAATRQHLDNTPDAVVRETLLDTAQRMEAVRALLGGGISVSSGYRSPAVNKAVGGAPTSAHTTGHAVDFNCFAFGTPAAVCLKIAGAPHQTNWLGRIRFDQLILEGDWVHISFAPAMRQELLTKSGGGYKAGIIA